MQHALALGVQARFDAANMATYKELEESLEKSERAVKRSKSMSAEMETRLVRGATIMAGGAAAALTTLGTGYLEQRVRNKAGEPLSVGPVSLPTVVGMATGTVAAGLAFGGFDLAAGVTGHVASAHIGLASGTVGRGLGLKHYSASGSKKKSKAGDYALAGASDEQILQALMHDSED